MYSYINKNLNLLSIEEKNNEFNLYKNEQLVLHGNMNPLKKIGLPVRPFEYKDCFILLDYDKGVKIYKNNVEYYFKFTSIFDIGTINNYIIFFGQKKIYIVDIDTLKIVKEMGHSESLRFSENGEYALFYRFKNNKSYLVDFNNNKIISLKKFIKDDVLIHKIYVKDNDLYVLMSQKFNDMIIKYNLVNYKSEIIDVLGDGDASIEEYYDCFQMTVNDEYKIEDKESLNYIEFLCYIYKKYGLFVTLYTINNEKLNSHSDTKYCNIVSILQNLITKLDQSENPIKSYEKLKILKEEIDNAQNELENAINKTITF